MNILILNCGSSSLKFQLITTSVDAIANNADRQIAHGHIERIGGAALVTLCANGAPEQRSACPVRDIRAALELVFQWIASENSGIAKVAKLSDIDAVGHRVVHGGENFSTSVLITDDVIRGIQDCIDLAPLHNPANIEGIFAIRQLLGDHIPQVAVFDTAFHQTLPERAYIYAVPYQLYRRHRLRRYGFHGTSHRYIAYRYRTIKDIPRQRVNVITLHLGNGCSITAIKNGNSIDTSMGLTPLEGLVMGTRSGDIDPAMIEFICAKEGMTIHEAESLLNNQSGLLGISGLTNDMRELIAETAETGDHRSRLAIEIFCYRAAKYIGAYLVAMSGTDAIIFAGGIGENSPEIRKNICSRLEWMGIVLDNDLNASAVDGRDLTISTTDSRIELRVICTNEESLIARDTARLVEAMPARS